MSGGFRPSAASKRAAYDRQQEAMAARTEDTTRRIDEIIASAEGDRRDWWIDFQADRLERLGR